MIRSKLIYISGSIIPSQTANVVHVMKMCQAFAKNGFDVDLLAYSFDENECVETIFDNYGVCKIFSLTLVGIKSINRKFSKNLFKIAAYLNRHNRKTIVYGREVNSLLLAALLGFKVYYESHGMPVSKFHETVEKFLFKSKNLVKIVVISDKLKNLYIDGNFGVPPEKCIVLHDAADMVPQETKKTSLGEGFHVGYTGSLYYEGRGIDLILEVARKNMDFTFHLVGGSSDEIKYWKKKASKNVELHGFVDNRDIPSLLISFDVVLMPYQKNLKFKGMNYSSVEWMSPMKMFEYMSARKAIVSSNLPVIREILNEKNSLLVEPESVEGWSYSIRKLYTNPEFKDAIAGEAYQDFSENYTWDKRVERLCIKQLK